MELSSGSSSRTTNNTRTQQMCYCGVPAKIYRSKTERNPHRRFFGCEMYKEGGTSHCKFFKWFDEEEVNGWPKRALILAQAEIREKDEMVDRLTKTVMELRRELEKIQTEDEDMKITQLELKMKIDAMGNVVYRQRIIITGLSGLLVCAIGTILFG